MAIVTKVWHLLKETFISYFREDPMSYSAAIAFYTIFSLPAILIVILVMAGTIFGEQAVSGQLFYQIEELVGAESALEIQKIIQNASLSEAGTFAKIIGIGTLIFSATTVFVSIQNGLNKIWGVKSKPRRGWLKFMVNRALSFSMVIIFGVLLLLSFAIEAGLQIFKDLISHLFSGATLYIMWLVNLLVSIVVNTFIFGMIFKVLPDAVIRWKDVWIGAFFTTFLFILGRLLISFYLANSDFSNTYGAAGSLVLILMWVYYSTVIMLLGAQFTQVYSHQFGKIIVPTQNAVRVIEKEVHPTDKEALV